MAFGSMCLRVLSAHPTVGRSLLCTYLRRHGPVPERAGWVVENLKRRFSENLDVCEVELERGIRMEIDPRAAIGRQIFFHRSCEPGLARRLKELLKPGDVFVDAGANVGEFTLRAAHLVGPTGHVYSLEASPITIRRLQRNVSLNRFNNITVMHAAICDRQGQLEFYLGRESDSGSSSLSPPHDFTGETVVVPGLTLDGLMQREGRDRVHAIKLDVEGAELQALEGARSLLGGDHPPVVILEYNPSVAQRCGWNLAQMSHWLQSLRYQVDVIPDRSLRGLGSGNQDGKCDVIAWPPRASDPAQSPAQAASTGVIHTRSSDKG